MATATNYPSLGHVLVTGGCGFVGHHVVRMILLRHPQSTVSVLDLTTTRNRIDDSRVSYHDGDLTKADLVAQLLQKLKPDVVIHTASPPMFLQKDILYAVNVEGTKALLEASQTASVKAFVYTSSSSVVMPLSLQVRNGDERLPYAMGKNSPEHYSETKALAEQAVLEANRTAEHPRFLTCAIRPAGIVGEGDAHHTPHLLRAASRGSFKVQLGDNTNLFDMTYVENVVHGHLLAAVALLETYKRLPSIPLDHERVDGEAFNITNESPTYYWDLARYMSHSAGYYIPPTNKIWVLPLETSLVIAGILEWVFWILRKQPNFTRRQAMHACSTRFFSTEKARRRLGYAPIVDLKEGMKRTAVHTRALMEAEAAKKK